MLAVEELLQRKAAAKRELLRRQRQNKFHRWFPDEGPRARSLYPKHIEAINLSATKPYVMCFGGNSTGKTELGAYWTTAHATGLYPDWWKGKRFDGPTIGYAATETWGDVATRCQYKLLGTSTYSVARNKGEALGTGMIPGDLIVNVGPRVGTSEACAYVDVKHVKGGVSRIEFRCYEQGREGFQGTERHYAWCDEEDRLHGAAIFAEIVQRFRGPCEGGVYLHTMTSLYGWTELATMFVLGMNVTVDEKQYERSGRAYVAISQNDVPHISEDDRERRLANAEHGLAKSRRTGMPDNSEGNVYPIPEEEITIPSRVPPASWRRVWVMDPGYKDPCAIQWAAIDPSNGHIELYDEHYLARSEAAIHAAAVKWRGKWIPGVIDTYAGREDELNAGHTLLDEYRKVHELNVVPVVKGEIADGHQIVFEALSTGRLKVQKHLKHWLHEYRLYRYDPKTGKAIGPNHHMDCTRYLLTGGAIERARTEAEMNYVAPRVREQTFGLS